MIIAFREKDLIRYVNLDQCSLWFIRIDCHDFSYQPTGSSALQTVDLLEKVDPGELVGLIALAQSVEVKALYVDLEKNNIKETAELLMKAVGSELKVSVAG